MSFMLYVFLLPGRRHPSVSSAQSFRDFFIFLMDCVVMKQRSPQLLNFRLASEDSPPSVQTTNFDFPKSCMIFFSNGWSVVCSLWFPGVMEKASGSPDLSMKSPMPTMGLGRCSLLGPYCFRPSSDSVSKK